MLFDIETLTHLNKKLIHKGYNYFDCNIGKSLLNPHSNLEMAKLSRMLIKYCGILNEDINIMKETFTYYNSLLEKPFIYIDNIDKTGVWCKWLYSSEIELLLKGYSKNYYKWIKESDGWKCRIDFIIIKSFYKDLLNYNFDLTDLNLVIKNNSSLINFCIKNNQSNINTFPKGKIKLSIGRLNSDLLSIKFDWSNPVSKSVQYALEQLSSHVYHKAGSYYTIQLREVIKLSNILQKLNIQTNDLEFWVCQMSHLTHYEIKDFSYLKRKPFDYQIEDVKLMLEKKSLILGNQMGCGKTFEVVMCGESLDFPKLVICPASLRLNWEKEIKMVNPDADIVILRNDDTFKVGKDWTIISYNSVPNFQFLLECEYFQAIFLDEAHFIRAINKFGNPDSIRASSVLKICATAEYVFPVTGTPIPNKNKDLYNLLKIIRHPLTLGKDAWKNYKETYCSGNGSSNNNLLHKLIKDSIIRHLKSEVLPSLKKQRTFIPNEVDLKEYNKEIELYLSNRESKAAEQLARLTKARVILAKQKVAKTIEFCDELLSQNEQVIIATNFNCVVKSIKEYYKDNVCCIVGGMTDKNKEKSVQDFQTGKKKVLVGNIIAAGVGFTLTKSHIVIFNDYPWLTGDIVQMEDRVSRPGQTSEYCNIYYMYAQGADIDEFITEILSEKAKNINSAIDGGKDDVINMTELIREMLENKKNNQSSLFKTKKDYEVNKSYDFPTSIELLNEYKIM